MRHPAHITLAVAALAAGALLTGCGSVVSADSIGGTRGGAASNGLGGFTDATSGPSSAPDAGGSLSADAAAPSAAADATGTGTDGAQDSYDYSGAAGGGGTAVSSSSKPIVVGITYAKPAGAGLAAIGAAGSGTFGNQQHYGQIVVDDINARGGLHGRKIQPVFFGYDANPGAPSYEEQDQTACATFLQDHHVEIAWTFLSGDGLVTCLQKKGVPMVDASTGTGYGKSFFSEHPLLFSPSFFNADRETTEWVKALKRQSYFSKWNQIDGNSNGLTATKIGVIAYNYPTWIGPTNNSLMPALTALGYGKPQLTYVAAHDSYSNLTAMETQIQAAVLNFKANGITHVVLNDDNGVMTLFFMTNAAQQSYKPRYAITSGNNMYVVSQLVSKEQLHGSTGIGWTPIADLGPAKEGGKYSSVGRKACNALMAKHDESGSQYNEGFALIFCEMADFTKQRYDAATLISQAGFAKAMEATGASFQPLMTPQAFIGPGRHDGLGAIYDYAFDDGCQCMAYTSGPKALAH